MGKVSVLLLSSVFCVLPVNAQTLQITTEIQTLSGFPDGNHGSGFMIDGGLIVTSSHVIHPTYPSLKKGVITANGIPLELVCYDNKVDLALLRPLAPLSGVQPLKFHDNVTVGMEYVAKYSYDKGLVLSMPHSVGEWLEIPLSLEAKGRVINVVLASVRRADHTIEKTDVKLIVTGTDAAKPGFSGGPVISDGKVIGVVMAGEAGSYGILSHIDNLKKLLQRKDCQQ